MEGPKRKPAPKSLEKTKKHEMFISSDADFYELRDIVWSIVAPDAEKLEGDILLLEQKRVFVEFVQPIIDVYSLDSGIDRGIFSSVYIGWDYDWYFGANVSPEEHTINLQRVSDFFTHLALKVKHRDSNLN